MIRINKVKARKCYNEGKSFTIVACKMRPKFGIIFRPTWKEQFRDFDAMVNNFEYYNCNNETGRYAAYYI